jgi:hypothetical protein
METHSDVGLGHRRMLHRLTQSEVAELEVVVLVEKYCEEMP